MQNQESNTATQFPTNQHEKPPKDTLGIVGMVLGILGILSSFCCTFLSLLPGLAAIVCGIIARNQGQRYGLTGIILGIIAIIGGFLLTLVGMT